MNTDNIYWYGHDAFRIDDNGVQIYIDPWKLPNDAPHADIILISHSHYDHYSAPDIQMLKKTTTQIIVSHDIATKETGAIALLPNQTYTAGKVTVLTVPAYNINKQFHKQDDQWLGFIVTLSNGIRIKHSGDTDLIPEMDSIETDVALLPVSGTYVMTAEEAVKAATIIKPAIAIPMHYGDIVGSREDAEYFITHYPGISELKEIVS